MKYADRLGNRTDLDSKQDSFLKALYTNAVGRAFLGILTNPVISKVGGAVLNTKVSVIAANKMIKQKNMDMSIYEKSEFCSYNDFFMRKIKPEQRPIDMDSTALISPCDSNLTVSAITDDCRLNIKNTTYSVKSLLRDSKLAEKYAGGWALTFRLTVDDYHHYCYIDSGVKSHNRRIQGVLHTVNPIANDLYPIYKENSREYCMLRSENFGDVIMMEVGALMVGKIKNEHEIARVAKGQEKGHFEFGGSTIVVLLEAGKAVVDEDILANSKDGYETKVKMGERIGKNI